MHLDEQDVARYLDGRIGEAERRNVEVHLAECPVCSERVAEARQTLDELQDQEAPPLEPEVRRKAEALGPGEQERWGRNRRLSRSVAIAGALVVVLGLAGILYWQLRSPAPSRLRSSSDAPTLTVQAPADGATVSERPVFVCAPVSEAIGYRVTLRTAEGTVVWEGDTTAARVHLPADVSLTPGDTYLWRAEALRGDGTTLRSTLRTFTYAP